MTYDPQQYHRHSIRLPGYDYSQVGAYFITICTYQRECLFGEIVDGVMQVNVYGEIIAECWEWLSVQYPYVAIDEWIVMPNHFHGLLAITDACRGGSRTVPTAKWKPLGRLVGAFKTVSTKRINVLRNMPGIPIWQRNYYEHIIRNEHDLYEVRQYIVNNPLRWTEDENNPAHLEILTGAKDKQVGNRIKKEARK